MRRAERFMQIQVHHVHARVPGPHNTGQCVHVRAVHVQQRAFGMQNFRNFRNTLFENSQRRRIGNHQRRHVFAYQIAQFIHVNLSVRFGFDVLHFVAGNHCGRRICAMRRVWD